MPEILTSLHGRRFGLDTIGNLVTWPDSGTGPKFVAFTKHNDVAAGPALTNSTAETILAGTAIKARSLQAGQLVKVRFAGIVTAANATDTLTVRLRLGGVAGTVLLAMAAQDVAANDVFTGEYELAVRSAGAAGTMVGVGTFKAVPAAEGTMTVRDDVLPATAIDTTVDQVLAVTGQWSAANAGNSCRSDFFRVQFG